ncbi:MAG TPA: RNA methyltransferase [Bacteroidales bacterium]|nr:RNA methyltransferase [Bacteroidales bacterium]
MITSLQNPRVKWLQQLAKPKLRKQESLFVIEGLRELKLAVEAGYEIAEVFYSGQLINPADIHQLLPAANECIELAPHVFSKLVYRESSDGVIAVASMKDFRLSNIVLPKKPFILVVESVEKPGNLGAILRTADAARVDAVIVADPHTDIFNANVVRSSLGTLFTCSIAIASNLEVFHFLQSKSCNIYAAALTAEAFYHETDLTDACAVVMGSEAFGLSEFWLNHCTLQIKIPMRGKVDSLNVSVSTAVICFEAMRQREFKP